MPEAVREERARDAAFATASSADAATIPTSRRMRRDLPVRLVVQRLVRHADLAPRPQSRCCIASSARDELRERRTPPRPLPFTQVRVTSAP